MAESRSPYRDSYKPPLRLVGLIVLVAVLVGGCWICNAVGDNILTNWLSSQCLLIESQNKIEWLEKPNMDGDFLVVSGRVKDGAQLHDARTEYGDTLYSAFTVNETEGEEELDVVAAIWPREMSAWLDTVDDSDVFAETYRIDSGYSDFYIKAELPSYLSRALQRDVKLALVVWEKDPRLSIPLGVECIER